LRGELTSRRDSRADATRLFATSIGLAACGAVAVGISMSGVGSVTVKPAARAGHFVLLGLRFTYPDVNLAAAVALALAALGAVVVCLVVRGAARELRSRHRFARAIKGRIVQRSGDLCVFTDPNVQAFCAGLLRPRVYLSTTAARMLRADELAAVLAHERHHRNRRDPLRIALGRVLAHALFFMPVLRSLSNGYCATAELAADEAAIHADGGSTTALASAMLAFQDSTNPADSVGIAPERVDHLLGRHAPTPLPAPRLAAAFGSAALISLLAVEAQGLAVAHFTLNLPLLSAQPCIAVLALIPGVLGTIAVRYLRRPATA
jgi:Zn-dependent protease with chaperone function